MINSFSGEYRFLSNFWPVRVSYEEEEYPSVEHAYTAAKTLNKELRKEIQKVSSPGSAKKLGRRLVLRSDWGDIKLSVMESLLQQKFSKDPLKKQLLNTKPLYLEEGNNWGDVFWGVCKGVGQNNLGKLLMKIRDRENI
jgi:ribA/ribD-fused uncharacterized protein